jgi:hypothetical protein
MQGSIKKERTGGVDLAPLEAGEGGAEDNPYATALGFALLFYFLIF